MILDKLKKDKYLYLYNNLFNVVSIFDHIRYDRSDYDMLSPPQRSYLLKLLLNESGKQITGRTVTFENNFLFTFPRANSMSQSPGDVLKELSRVDGEYLVLTPTQLAYAIIKEHEKDFELILEDLHSLISKQPINIDKILDYSENENMKTFLKNHIEDLKNFQREVVSSESMKGKKHLGAIC